MSVVVTSVCKGRGEARTGNGSTRQNDWPLQRAFVRARDPPQRPEDNYSLHSNPCGDDIVWLCVPCHMIVHLVLCWESAAIGADSEDHRRLAVLQHLLRAATLRAPHRI